MADLSYPEEKYEEIIEDREKARNPIRNINKWAILVIGALSMIIAWLIMYYGGPYYMYIIEFGIAFGILYLLANQTPATGFIDGTEAEIIAYQETNVKRQVENIYGITIGEGDLINTGTWLHRSPWNGDPMIYEIGYKVKNKAKFFSVRVNALRNYIGYEGWSPRDNSYKGENYIIVRQKVPVSDTRFYRHVPDVEIRGM